RPNLTLSYGLRYERQTNISSNLNFGPRVAFAWSPGGGSRQAKTVVRGGAGIFFERGGENLTLQSDRFNGLNQMQFTVPDPTNLGIFPRVPALEDLSPVALRQEPSKLA